MRLSFVVVLLVSLRAFAQEPLPLVAPFPLDVKRTPSGFSKKEKEELQKLFPMLVRGSDAAVPESAKLSSALSELKRQDCEREDGCLTQLAKLAGALYGLYVSVDYTTEKHVIAVGRIVRDDGVSMGPAQTVDILKANGAFKNVARDALNQVLTKLAVGKLSPFRPAATAVADQPASVMKEPAKEMARIEPPPPPPPQFEKHTSIGRIMGWVGVGVGAAVGVAGVIAFATAPVVRKDGDGNILPADRLKLAPAQAQQAVGVGLMAGGFGVVAVGAVMVAISKDSETVKTTLVPVPGGAVVMVGGSF